MDLLGVTIPSLNWTKRLKLLKHPALNIFSMVFLDDQYANAHLFLSYIFWRVHGYDFAGRRHIMPNNLQNFLTEENLDNIASQELLNST
jgi:hypothetical protein